MIRNHYNHLYKRDILVTLKKMDSSLLKQHEAFKKRAIAVPVVEKRKTESESDRPAKKPKPAATSPAIFDYKATSGSSQYKFAILAKIIKHMKNRHQDGQTHELTFEEILDETNQMDITLRHKHWLETEALLNNPKIEVIREPNEPARFKFKGKLNIRNRAGLLKLLDKNDQLGLGGTFLEDVEESLPECKKHLKKLGDQIIYITRSIDKKQVLYYNDKSYEFKVDEELQKLWRSATVEGMDERKIEEYLNKQGIASMQHLTPRAAPMVKRKGGGNKKARQFKSHNDHLGNVLQDYSGVKK